MAAAGREGGKGLGGGGEEEAEPAAERGPEARPRDVGRGEKS